MKLLIGGRKRNIWVGPKGGKYYMKGGVKVYVRGMNGGSVNTVNIQNKPKTSLLLIPGQTGEYSEFGTNFYKKIHATIQKSLNNTKTVILKNGQPVLSELDIELLKVDDPEYTKIFTDEGFKEEYCLFLAERKKQKNVNNNVNEVDWSPNYLNGIPVTYKNCVDEGEGPQKSLRTYRYQSLKYYLKSKSDSINHLVLLGHSEGGAFLLLLLQDTEFCELFKDRFTAILVSPAFATQVILNHDGMHAKINSTQILGNIEKYGIKLCLINTNDKFDDDNKSFRQVFENSLIESDTMITLVGSNHSISNPTDVDKVWEFVHHNRYVIPYKRPQLTDKEKKKAERLIAIKKRELMRIKTKSIKM
jgi:hypothetical protein